MKVTGSVRVPGDKSISHRALMFAALGDGPSRITRILDSADVRSTAGVLRALGADMPELSADFVVTGHGLRGLRAPVRDLDCGNSGTTARLMAGVCAAQPFASRFVGDESLSKRPMGRVARPLSAMGASFELSTGERLPMVVHGTELEKVEWHNEKSSAQVKSAILLAGVCAGVEVVVREPTRSRDHTERMLAARGAEVWVNDDAVLLWPVQGLPALDVAVPGDPSSAAFFVALAALATEGTLTLPDVCLNPTRTGFFFALARMGVRIDVDDERTEGGETVGTLAVSPGELRSTEIAPAEVPSLIDELPMLACLATRAEGETVVRGAEELRVKESDRIAAVVGNLRALGADADELPDGFVVRGNRASLKGRVTTHGDHRLAMAFGVLGALPGNEIEVDDPACVDVSFPTFWRDLDGAVR
ncbi:3-phosphoshikimate 1-carboxyvinyltransferase [Gemmatirosa kalamazoonensis]|uniref:3-phosphoshikimate 1-carboxyvinyltransferase n=1 Tax=Gemmatirosa kalamazoonensis TaxID=861299 RepID=W0RIM8_9BACT|nr:3-phosphoshikimate 1-carboxyvinyltransferase [Gemmatirosa kalamazoonensis]AHG90959.1 3-phosphoshikimate 1-carboxyvinyltransferase [Gemmatirosa kalamazoonensis]